MRRRTPIVPLLLQLLLVGTLAAQAAAPPAGHNALPPAVQAGLQRLFASPELASERFGPARWLGTGDAYTTVEKGEIVRYDTRKGARAVLVSAAMLTPNGSTSPLELEDYTWSRDGKRVLIFTNSARVWRDNTRGDYWVLELASGALKKLGGDAPASTLMFAKFSPRGDRVAYVRQGDLYVESIADGRITRLTNDGSTTRVNGTTDWVYEEEFGLRDAFRWSETGPENIAYWQFDMSGVRDFLLINDTDSLYPYTIPVQYPKAGTTNSAVRAGVVSADGGPTTWLKLPGDPRDDYLPRMEWVGAGQLILQRMNRIQNTNRLMTADPRTGEVREVMTERDSAWLDVVEDMPLVGEATQVVWPSERDGWRHLYTVDLANGQAKLLTPGNYDAFELLRVLEGAGIIYFIASPENATQRYLYRVPVRGGAPVRVTPADQPGTHTYDISPMGKYALHTWSRMDQPPRIELIELPSHRVVRTLVQNTALTARAAGYIPRPTEFFRIDIGNGVQLDGWMMLPKDFDPSKKYPMLMHAYTEPAGVTVVDRWGGNRMLWHRFLADQGYIVASVDNRGTPSPRGRDFRKIVYKQIGILASRDQADAVRALVRTRPYIDGARVGIWGWSGGGSATLNAMFRYPDVYAMGMSVAPVPDEHLYDTVYQERYMGLPQGNDDAYTRGSAITHAAGLRGDLLVVHGSGDDNVHYQGTERLVNKLVELGKPFDLMVYPNRSHGIYEGPGTTMHVYSLLTRYLLTHLAAGGR